MRTLVTIFFASILAAGSVRAQNTDEALIADAKRSCEQTMEGSFKLSPGAITYMDVTGDSEPETIVNSCRFYCTKLYYGGSAGCPLTIFRGDKAWTYYQQAWTTYDWPEQLRIILLFLHGTGCGGAGSDPCVAALVWNGETFVSIANKK